MSSAPTTLVSAMAEPTEKIDAAADDDERHREAPMATITVCVKMILKLW